MKKLLISIGTILSVAAPVAATISCGFNSAIPKETDQFFKVVNDSKDIDSTVVNAIQFYLNRYVNEFTEAQALKPIHIFDSTNAPYVDESDYLVTSNEIIFNTSIMSHYTNFEDADKFNYISQILAHEYNHYVDHSYLMNISESSPMATDEIHDWNGNGEVQPWPKSFIDDFKKDLKYDEDTSLYDDVEVAPGFKSLGSVYNQKDLFDMANGSVNPLTLYKNLKGNEVMAPINPTVQVNSKRVIKAKPLSYIYSMDELFARKMQLATTQYWGSKNIDQEGYFKDANGAKHESPYLQDVVNYQRGLKDFDNNGIYLNDKPNEEVASLYSKARGENYTSISYAEIKNNKYVQPDGTFKGTNDRTRIRFGGAVADNINTKLEYVGYLNGEDFVNIPIHISDRTDKDVSKRDYLTDFVKATDIIGKTLYFAENSKGLNKVAISSTRDNKYGLVSTHRYLDDPNTVNYVFSENAKLQTL